VAWSVAGSALLVGELPRFSPAEATGAYLVAGVAVALLGRAGWFGRLLRLVPESVVLGMLAGVLLRFGIGLFAALPARPPLVAAMIAAFLVLQRRGSRAPTVGALVVGLLIAGIAGDLRLGGLAPALAVPRWVWPAFTPTALLGLALPLFVLAITSQDAPGVAVLRAAGYDPPVDGPILATGLASVLTAPFGGHGLNLAALMGVICAGPEAHPDPERRYGAGVAAAVWFLLLGAFGATAATLFAGLPPALVAATAGLAMTPALLAALTGALAEPTERTGALFALLLTAADIHLLGLGAPFWGLVVGLLASRALRHGRG
jgi:benzoate membrane transport protein